MLSEENKIRMQDQFYDAVFNRYLVVDGIGIDPNYFFCIVYRYGDPGELEIAGRGMFHKSALLEMERR